MKQQVIGSLALFFAAASAMPFLAVRQDNSNADLSSFHGSWYLGGMSDNVKGMLNDMATEHGFDCSCYHMEFDGGDSGSTLKQHAACDIIKDNKSLGQVRMEGSLEFSSHEDDMYTFKYTMEDTAFYPADGSDPMYSMQPSEHHIDKYDAHYRMLESDDGDIGLYEWVEYDNESWGVLYGKDHTPDEATYDEFIKDLGNDAHMDGLMRANNQC